MVKQLILLESYTNNKILAVKYSKITLDDKDEYRLSGHINFEEENIPSNREIQLETAILLKPLKEYIKHIDLPEKVSLKDFNKKRDYLDKISLDELKEEALKPANKHNINIENFSNNLLKRMILGYEEIKGNMYYSKPDGELVFSNLKQRDVDKVIKIGSADLLLKNLVPRFYCFDNNYSLKPTIYIR